MLGIAFRILAYVCQNFYFVLLMGEPGNVHMTQFTTTWIKCTKKLFHRGAVALC